MGCSGTADLRTFSPYNPDVDYMHGVVEEFVEISGFQVMVYLLQNRTIDEPTVGTEGDAYHVPQENIDLNKADPLLGEMRKRVYDAGTLVWCLPDSLERENYLEKFGLISQDTMNLHFAIKALEIKLSRRLMPGDIIELPNEIEARKYEISDAMRSDYQLYNAFLWKVNCAVAHTSQDIVPIDPADITYGSELLSNDAIENISEGTEPDSGRKFLDEVFD